MRPIHWRAAAVLVGVLAAVVLLQPMLLRGTHAAMNAQAGNPANIASNLSLTSPTGLTASMVASTSATLSWTAATPSNVVGGIATFK